MRKPCETTRVFVGVLAVVAAFAVQVQAQTFLTNGLVAYYTFDGNADDGSGNGNNGTLFGSAAFGTDRFGNPNSCLTLPGTAGTGSGVDIPSLSNLPYLPITYSAWFWLSNPPPDTGGQTVMTLVGREQCGSQAQGAICVMWLPASSTVNDLTFYAGASGDGYSTFFAPPTNQWCQVVLTIDASQNGHFYFDGTNVATLGNVISSQPLDFRIGASSSGSCGGNMRYVWNGRIDDVRIYNRAFLSNEVQELYAYESSTETPCVPHAATATATVVNGFVVAATITDVGCGYSNTPQVFFQGGGGTGAAATAVVSNGFVYNLNVGDAGSNYTNAPAIAIGFKPYIINEPQSVTVNAYETASFSVDAAGTTNLDYQWSLNGTNISGATSSTLVISNVVQTNLGTYAVVVTNVFGTTNSSAAVLSMYPFLVEPFSGLVTDWGYTNVLSVGAWGSGPLSYQWFDNGAAIDNATNSSLNLAGVQFTNAGVYTVVVKNAFGSTTNMPEQVVVNPSGISLVLYAGVTITGVTGHNYIIQSTTNLSNTNDWLTVGSLVLTQPVQTWVDTNVNVPMPGNPQRYYQVLLGP